VYHRTSN